VGRRTILAVVLFAAAVTGCSDSSSADEDTVRVVATTTQTADFARVIGGDRVTVYDIVKAGVDPHDFEPSPADIDALAGADVIVQNGVGLEHWLDDAIDSAGGDGTLVDTSEDVEVNGDDPHIWHDPDNAKLMCEAIAAVLEAADPDGADSYRENLADYSAELDDLDAEIQGQIDTLTNKKMVTNHDAFSYYIDHFGLEFVGSVIPSFDTSAELSGAEIDDLVAKIKAEGVTAVFSESSLPPKTAEAIASEAGVQIIEGEDALYGDSLGPKGSEGDTYLKMERHNTSVIVSALRGGGS